MRFRAAWHIKSDRRSISIYQGLSNNGWARFGYGLSMTLRSGRLSNGHLDTDRCDRNLVKEQ